MKTVKYYLIATLAISITLGFSSCQKSAPISPDKTLNISGDTYIPPQNNAPSTIEDATLDMGMTMIPPQDGYLYQYSDANGNNCPNMTMGRDMGIKDMGIFNLSRIFRQMKVTQDEMTQIKPLIQAYMDCMKTAMQALRASEQPIIQNANTERQSIMSDLRAGTITKDSARHALMILNKTTRDSLKNNPARVTACEAMQACKQTLFDGIRAILDDNQKALWDAWVAKFPVIDCSKIIQ